jgi:Cdc6-like AAA superfamily ATPase
MIYPEFFPKEREKEIAENMVFDLLKKVSDKYDIFYAKKFVTDGVGKRPEYEIDFIIAIPNEAIICLEVKGGIISYSGNSNSWTQNGQKMSKNPDDQSSSAAHSLAKTYPDLLRDIPVGWGVCFPDCQIQDAENMSDNIDEKQIFDALKVQYLEKALPYLFEFTKNQYPFKKGARTWMYEKFKNQLLRNIGFVQILSTKIKYDENRFIELTNYQLELFKRISTNKNIITSGPAGCGKTIVAKTIAQDLLNDGKTVLFLCFNRTLANKIRYEFDRNETKIEVATFHSLARRIIEKQDENWWKENCKNKSDDFWDIEIPIKLEECLSPDELKFDAIIIDEGQDFKEFWYEIIFKLAKPESYKMIFMDEMQNIFGHYTAIPNQNNFIKYNLPENCRNTKNIVKYLSTVLEKEIKSFEKTPQGEEIIYKEFKNQIEEQKYLLDEIKSLTKEHEISTDQILVLLNSEKADSCLSTTTKAGSLPIVSLDRSGRMERNSINYTTINTFKGLEADIVFIIDADKIQEKQKLEKLYTEASRARFKLYLLKVNL